MVFKSSINQNNGSGGGSVNSVTGLNTDNADPANPVVKISVDGVTITGQGTPADPLVGTPSGVTSVSNSDGTLAITPTTGAVVASLASLSSSSILIGNLSGVATPRTLAGDATLTNNGTITLATVNANVGSFGSTIAIPNFAVNAKGLLTAAGSTPVVAPAGTLTGTTIGSTVITSFLTSVGILTGGATGSGFTVNIGASTVSGILLVPNGGTGAATLSNHGVLIGAGTGVIQTATTGIAGAILTDQGAGADPAFKAVVGDFTFTANGTATLATVNSNIGSFGSSSSVSTFTVNAKGLLTAAGSTVIQIAESQVTNLVSDLASKQSTTLTDSHILVGNASNIATDKAMVGDATLTNNGSIVLATVNSNVGNFGSSTAIPAFAVNAKGLMTAASTNPVVAPAGTLTGTTLGSSVVTSFLTSLGTLTNLTVTNPISGSVTGNAGTVTVGAENADTTSFPLFSTAASGSLSPKTSASFTFNALTSNLSAVTFTGAFVGSLTGTASVATASVNIRATTDVTDTTCFLLFSNTATGNIAPKTNASFTFNSVTSNLTAGGFTGSLAGSTGLPSTDGHSRTFERPLNQLYIAWLKVPFDCTITAIDHICLSGSIGAAYYIRSGTANVQGTLITSGTGIITTTIATLTPSGANVITAGNHLQAVFSSNSLCKNAEITFKYTRTLPT